MTPPSVDHQSMLSSLITRHRDSLESPLLQPIVNDTDQQWRNKLYHSLLILPPV